ncbi:hypothetical protein LENED_004454 [Lentinula edodes]|uniref:Uncharacterized protein n=1 Tax=Lentinula edodes TaxID=5353 RepID=A0A1Q3E6Y5_LENED|nr:hypothetical protein LENED_004454 [Lentinula edodes]
MSNKGSLSVRIHRGIDLPTLNLGSVSGFQGLAMVRKFLKSLMQTDADYLDCKYRQISAQYRLNDHLSSKCHAIRRIILSYQTFYPALILPWIGRVVNGRKVLLNRCRAISSDSHRLGNIRRTQPRHKNLSAGFAAMFSGSCWQLLIFHINDSGFNLAGFGSHAREDVITW